MADWKGENTAYFGWDRQPWKTNYHM